MKISRLFRTLLGLITLGGVSLFAQPQESSERTVTDFPALVGAIKHAFSTALFSPDALPATVRDSFFAQLDKVTENAQSDADFEGGFQAAASALPFSHVFLQHSAKSLPDLLRGFDEMEVGPKAVQIRMQGNIAVLRVKTMMGRDTIAAIDAAYAQIAQDQPHAFILDLRGNQGGAFAIIPLVENLLSQPVDAGWFFGRTWWEQHRAAPTASDVSSLEPWHAYSLLDFWQDVSRRPLLRIRFLPRSTHYVGPVFVLTDNHTASASEIAVATLKTAGRATIVGEPTAGQVLSQLPHDVGQGYKLSIPIADYVSASLGRLEGHGIKPDVACPSAEALNTALRLATDA